MALTGDGGDKGVAVEASTHPKSQAESTIAPVQGAGQLVMRQAMAEGASNWEATEKKEAYGGPEDQIDGEVDMDDVAFIELEPEEEDPAAESQWKMLGRYYAQRIPNADQLFERMNVVWQLRTGMTYVPLKDNFFIITFYSKGDFNFVSRGGPWIFKGYPLLVAPFIGAARPSETILNSVPVWTRIYDVQWNKQTQAMGRALGGTLGKGLEVDIDEARQGLNEYLRVRVELPLNRRLQTKITTRVKGKDDLETYELKYERVPYFCFKCGFIGHEKEGVREGDTGVGQIRVQYGVAHIATPEI
ncbi:uncharacterized protein LOC100842450 [Brachypodium distachyon]|uniref:uncharacterized protein LOC100842450 n=1 Tax=Brachypodium distachyon TaxID=15368 RepID=UPI0005300677|nr:uncharacterized protein LOC100842450 [Brachypodium distachyon]|eukprot:XP_010236280.1 uncharacterized protein LOC100842450 [Brachypodium distachyon]